MNQLTVQTDMSNALADVQDIQKLVSELMKTKHYQAMGEAGCFAVVQKAKVLGIHPLEALNGALYYVQGKVGMGSETMAALIRAKGHSIIKDPKSNNSICILHGKRADNGDTWSISFSLEDAKRAGILKNSWEKYPPHMCYNRAMGFLARQLFPDIIKGAGYTPEELHEIADNKIMKQHKYDIAPPAEAEIVIPRVSTEQANQLMDLLEYCDEEYKASVMKVIQAPPYNAVSLYEFPLSLYERCLKTSAQKMQEMTAKNSQQQQQAQPEQLELALDKS